MSKATLCLFVSIVVLFSVSAFSVDGVVLINQASVTAAGGFPYVITQSGSYKLTGNLLVPDANTSAIQVKTDNVTIDLNGFTISGPVTCTRGTFPVQCSAAGLGEGIFGGNEFQFRNNIKVTNGTITGMGGSAISLVGEGEVVDGVRALSNASLAPDFDGAIFVESGVVTHCTVIGNAAHGVLAGLTLITDSVVRLNGGDGIKGGDVVSHNSVSSNGENGIEDALLADNNSIFENIGFGIKAQSSGFGYLGNVLVSNGGQISGGASLGHNLCNGVGC